MVSGGMTCIKYLLFCFNLLFAISGLAILVVGAMIHAFYHHISQFVYQSFVSVPIVLIVAGVLVFIIAFFGCCGAIKENHCMIITFSVFLLIIFTLELAAGITGYVRRNEVGTMLKDRLNVTMSEYYTSETVRSSWDITQHELKCCGTNGPKDWGTITHNITLPHTCCPNAQNDGSCTTNSRDAYTESCLEKLKEAFINYGSIIGGVGIGVALIQLIGVVFACCLARSIRKEYETV